MKVKTYLYSNKQYMYEVGLAAGMTIKQAEYFKFAGYEHEMTYEVDEEGSAKLVEVDGNKLVR